MSDLFKGRQRVIQAIFILAAIALVGKAMHLQLFDEEFRKKAGAAAVVRAPQYPARGLIYDRNGKLLIHNNPIYDLMVTYSQIKPGMDTAYFCNMLGITPDLFDVRTQILCSEEVRDL
ncbi:MAG TPA: hypothetical protein PLI34_19030, partial [Saprospiraceae bacterium]|nr:hypothetical protein [Saprospiraceae bacterium]